MSIYAIGDLHLSMSGEKPMDVFGEEWVNHAERVAAGWRATVAETDTVLVAGDSSWGLKYADALPDLAFIAALPGKKILVKGNHDLWWTSTTRLNGFDPSMFFLQNTFREADGVAICGTRGWICPGDGEYTPHDEKIYRRELGRLEASLASAEAAGFSEKIVALHFPPTNDRREESGFTELIQRYGAGQVVYGHLHGADGFERRLGGLRDGTEYSLVSTDFLRCELKRIR